MPDREAVMYRIVLFLFITIGLAFNCSVGSLAQTPDAIRLTTGNWQPYTSEKAPDYGVASRIVTEAFALVGIEVEYGFFPWKRAMKLAREGTWDGSIIWYDTDERRADFFYSDAIVWTTISFFHLKSFQFHWDGFEDLSDLRVGGTMEYSYGAEFNAAERSGVFHTHRAVSDEAGLTNLLKGRIDVFPGELSVTYEQIHDTFSEEDAAQFIHHPRPVSRAPLFLLLSKMVPESAQSRDLFNEGLRQLKANGRYDEIIADGLGDEYMGSE